MVIKRKDGSEYKSGVPTRNIPQADSDFEIFNFDKIKETVGTHAKPAKLPKKIQESDVEIEEIPSKDLEEGTIQISIEKSEDISKSSPQKEIKKINIEIGTLKKVTFHCMTNLSNSVEVFMFEAIELDINAIYYRFWTSVELQRGYIVFPHAPVESRNNMPLGSKQWWKVSSIKRDAEGYIIQCIPSMICPKFGE